MSVRHGLLALLAEQPRYGYELRGEFESRTGATWPLNVGQVYTTLARLERDGCVTATPASESGQQYYEITAAGRAEVTAWFTTPVRRESRPRDELAIKLALAVGNDDIDITAVIQAQRTDSLRALQDYTRLKQQAGPPDATADVAWLLVLDAMVFQTEAEVRWLDHCESRLVQAARQRAPRGATTAPTRTSPQATR
ncbi:MAG TPA: PadR family transcriptional regulator [Mycobacteriales bacterium]|nr:PadR family transcriptional regulator [Mycobacteriales bacterium]